MSMRNPSVFWGVILVGLGVLFLLANTGVLDRINWDYVWPVALIALGVWLILGRVGPGGAQTSTDAAAKRHRHSPFRGRARRRPHRCQVGPARRPAVQGPRRACRQPA
jgi:hypothetical protein